MKKFKLMEFVKQFGIQDGSKTKTGLYLFLIGLLASQLGLDVGSVQGLADNIVELAGEIVMATGVAHDLYKKARIANNPGNPYVR